MAFLTYRGQILLLLRDEKPNISSPNRWCLIGGYRESGEEPDTTMRREAIEEIGVNPANLRLWCLLEIDGRQVYVYAGELSGDEFGRLRLGDEGQALAWFRFEDLAGLALANTLTMMLQERGAMIELLLRQSAGGDGDRLGNE